MRFRVVAARHRDSCPEGKPYRCLVGPRGSSQVGRLAPTILGDWSNRRVRLGIHYGSSKVEFIVDGVVVKAVTAAESKTKWPHIGGVPIGMFPVYDIWASSDQLEWAGTYDLALAQASPLTMTMRGRE